MYTKTTKKISITVNPYYLEDQSEPEDQHYVWAYQVTINNLSGERVQLKNRYWKIIDSNTETHSHKKTQVLTNFATGTASGNSNNPARLVGPVIKTQIETFANQPVPDPVTTPQISLRQQ